jgi:tetratricopeptide (TPR) repeat protein
MKKIEKLLLLCLCLLMTLPGCAEDKTVIKKRATAKQNLGMSLIREGDVQRGLQALLEAAELNPENAVLHNAIASAYVDMRELDKAVFHFKQALELKPDFPEAQNGLGAAYAELREWDLAIEFLRKASENVMYRTRDHAFNNLGYVHQQRGEYRKAIENYKKSVEVFPRNSPAYDNMGLAYESLGEWELAIEAYKKSIEYSSNFPVSHLNLGRLYLKLGRHEEAKKELFEAIKTDSRGPYAEEARKLMEQVKESR